MRLRDDARVSARSVDDGRSRRSCGRAHPCQSEAALARARVVAGLKYYVTIIPAAIMPAGEVISSYHDLWVVVRG